MALIHPLENQKFEAAKILVDSGAKVNIPNAFGLSPFIGATVFGSLELLTLMIQNGADLNRNYPILTGSSEPGAKNARPLELAIQSGRPEIVLLLLSFGADPSSQTMNGGTIAELAWNSEIEGIRSQF